MLIFTKRLFFLAALLSLSFSGFSQMWEQLNNPPFHKHHSNGFGYNGKAYVLEGVFQNDGPNQVSNELWEYTPETDSWVRLADFPGPARSIAIGDAWDDKYYYGFGTGSNGLRLTDLWVFDPADTSFTQLPSCPCVGRSHPALVAHNDKIFMGSGTTDNGDTNDWWEYDINTQQWTQKTNMPGGPRHHPFFFAIEDDIYVGGGHVFNWLKWDPSTEEWDFISNVPGGRVAGSQIDHWNRGFIIAGDDATHAHVPDYETFMMYNPDTDDWEYLPSLPNGSRWAPSSFIIDDVLYYLGGLDFDNLSDVSMWKFDLTFLDCAPPSGLDAVNIEANSAQLFWVTNSGGADTLKWRKLGESEWNVVTDPQAVYTLADLEVCQDYEFIVGGSCNDDLIYSTPYEFKTGGCCINPVLAVNATTPSTAEIGWPEVTGIDEYEVRWRVAGTTAWSSTTTTSTNFDLEGLAECTEYECQIKSICSQPDAPFSESLFFYTKNCGTCMDVEYCSIAGSLDGTYGFIASVQINNFENASGNNNGYGNFAIPESEEINIGESFTLTLTPGLFNDPVTWNAWIDFNANGAFELGEMVVSEFYTSEEISHIITIPADAQPGLTRMRIICGSDFPNPPCIVENDELGEAEDYCITITDVNSNVAEQVTRFDISASPNPLNDVVRFNGNQPVQGVCQLTMMNAVGEVIQHIDNYSLGSDIDMSAMASGVYFVTLRHESFSETIRLVKED
jgi:hypothetical protein